MTPDDIRTLLYRGVAWYSREQVQVLLESYDGAQAQREFEKQAYAKDRDARDRISREVVDHLIAERDAQAQPVNVEGPEHLAPRPAPGLAFDARGVLVPVKDAPVAWVQPDHLQKLRDGSFLCRCSPTMIHDFVPLYAAPPPADVPRLTDAEYMKIEFPYLDGALMETIELDGYALLEILRAVEAEVRRRMGVTK